MINCSRGGRTSSSAAICCAMTPTAGIKIRRFMSALAAPAPALLPVAVLPLAVVLGVQCGEYPPNHVSTARMPRQGAVWLSLFLFRLCDRGQTSIRVLNTTERLAKRRRTIFSAGRCVGKFQALRRTCEIKSRRPDCSEDKCFSPVSGAVRHWADARSKHFRRPFQLWAPRGHHGSNRQFERHICLHYHDLVRS